MAETSGFFDAEQLVDDSWDREYLAEQWANYFNLFIGNGVFATPVNQLKVVAYTGMNIKILPGWAFINGYWYHNDSELVLQVPANVRTVPVVDGVFIQFDSANRITSAVIGNNRSTVDRVSPHYELKIADITVNVGAVEITNANITDTRANESVCGFVTGLIDVINTEDLFLQYQTIFDEWITSVETGFIDWADDQEEEMNSWADEQRAMFVAWFNEMKGQLTEDAAGNLQAQIDTMRYIYVQDEVLYLPNTAATYDPDNRRLAIGFS